MRTFEHVIIISLLLIFGVALWNKIDEVKEPEYCYGVVYDYVNDSALITSRMEKIRQELAEEGKIVTSMNSFPNYCESVVYDNNGDVLFSNKVIYDFTIVVLFKYVEENNIE